MSERRATTARALERASGQLATAATARMDDRLAWFRDLPAEQRSWVGLIAQAGIAAVISWYRDPTTATPSAVDVFATAPRELAGAISLEQTVEMVRCTVDLLEELLPELAGPESAADVRDAVLTYSREIAFAAAEIYARAAEARGAWDARLEAHVMESLLRGDTGPDIAGQAAALGWHPRAVALVGAPPEGATAAALQVMRRSAEHHGLTLLTALHGSALVVLASGTDDGERTARLLAPHFGAGPLMIGPGIHRIDDIAASCRAALSAYAVAPAWPTAPRPCHADDLLPERTLAGEAEARRLLLAQIMDPLDPDQVRTLEVLLEEEGTIEGTARALFVHPNTVRHRIRRIEALTGCSPLDARDRLALRLALSLSRL